MIKRFSDWINESHQGDDESLEDIRRLLELGLIDHAEYLKHLNHFAELHSVNPATLLQPGEMIFDIDSTPQGDDEENLISPGMREAMSSFRGPKGEVPVWIKGKVDGIFYDFKVTLSDGSVFRIYYLSFYDEETLSLERSGQTYELDEESRDQVDEVLANHGEWSLYLHDALWMLLDLANGG